MILYPQRRPPAALRRLQDDLSGPFDRDVAAAGQAVDPQPRPVRRAGHRRWPGATACERPGPPIRALREFADFWLGKGYAEAHGENCPPAG